MASSRQLKTKIEAVGNIRQITRAMQLVAATKMRRSQETALAARPYAKKAMELLYDIFSFAENEQLMDESHFFKRTGRKHTCLVAVTSDKGLCGGFNSTILRAALQYQQEHRVSHVVTVGKKAQDFFRTRGIPVAASFSDFSDVITIEEVKPLADWLLTRYEIHEIDTVVFYSTIFISALTQRAAPSEVLPLSLEGLENIIQQIIPKRGKYSVLEVHEEKRAQNTLPYTLEPSSKEVFEFLLAELFRVEVLHLILESNASEHSARMVAMKNATENADRLQEELRLVLNKARQTAITQELTEISTAKEALTAE